MRTIHQGPRAPSPDSQAEYTQAIRPRYLPFFENALAFGGSPYTGLDANCLWSRLNASSYAAIFAASSLELRNGFLRPVIIVSFPSLWFTRTHGAKDWHCTCGSATDRYA